jgi:dTDP-4-dehydrorhamnose 3,5-epimerase
MKIEIENTILDAVKIIHLEVFGDERGFFTEVFNQNEYEKHGLPTNFVQCNHSGSIKNTVRGLHFQWEPPMGKLMRVIKGEAFLVAADIKKSSPTFGKWFGKSFNENNKSLLWAPAHFARGFCVLSDYAEIEYLTTGTYNSKAESGVLWNDKDIGVEWPVVEPILSEKDKRAQTFQQWINNEKSNIWETL